ncbi:MAG: hypothetical protein ACXVNF_08500 [Neobacillus sp.]
MSDNFSINIDNPHYLANGEETTTNTHQYIAFDNKLRTGVNSETAFMIVEYLFKNHQTRKKWRDDKTLYYIVGVDDGGNEVKSIELNYRRISEFIRLHGTFDRLHFNLLAMECRWMDSSLDYTINWHRFDDTGTKAISIFDGYNEQNYGKAYPIDPELDREGRSFTSLLPILIRRIIKMRISLINNSHLALTGNWFLDLRTLISDTISIIEITFNQIYIKAEFDPMPGWIFDKEKLGERHGRRFNDKLKWIYQISGNTVDAEPFMKSCNNLREVRNHLMHFDPPSLVITIEEMTIWLNEVIDVGYLLIQIRKTIGVNISFDLINFILQKEAIFVPEPQYSKRIPLSAGTAGYRSTVWR